MSNLKMIHPEIDAVADAGSIEGYHAVWAPRGWVLLDAPETFATEVLAKPVKNVDDLLVDELKALHSARGLTYPEARALKADLVKEFRATFPASEKDTEPELSDAEKAAAERAAAVATEQAAIELAAAEKAKADAVAAEAQKTPATPATPAAVAARSTSRTPDQNQN